MSVKTMMISLFAVLLMGPASSLGAQVSVSGAIQEILDFVPEGSYKGHHAADRVCYLQVREDSQKLRMRISVATIPVPYDFVLGQRGDRILRTEATSTQLKVRMKDQQGQMNRLIVEKDHEQGVLTVVIWNTDKIMNTSIPSQITCRFLLRRL